jgi:hypothetical protein
MAGEMGGTDAFARAALCLEVFRERELLQFERREDDIRLLLTDGGKKVQLEESPCFRRLSAILETPKRGGM